MKIKYFALFALLALLHLPYSCSTPEVTVKEYVITAMELKVVEIRKDLSNVIVRIEELSNVTDSLSIDEMAIQITPVFEIQERVISQVYGLMNSTYADPAPLQELRNPIIAIELYPTQSLATASGYTAGGNNAILSFAAQFANQQNMPVQDFLEQYVGTDVVEAFFLTLEEPLEEAFSGKFNMVIKLDGGTEFMAEVDPPRIH
ncbi:MAG: hypothetical protein JXQ90_06985 [Cyclobacteriaceae bacterium]